MIGFDPVKLREELARRDKSNAWLAAQAKIHPNTIGTLTKGSDPIENVRIATCNAVAQALGVNTVDLMHVEETPPPLDGAPAFVATNGTIQRN
jgi:DNA-binding Xre family transcriptional regulator